MFQLRENKGGNAVSHPTDGQTYLDMAFELID